MFWICACACLSWGHNCWICINNSTFFSSRATLAASTNASTFKKYWKFWVYHSWEHCREHILKNQAAVFNLRQLENASGELQIVNAFGQVVERRAFENTTDAPIRLDLADYQNGLYYYQIQLPNQPSFGGKFLVNRLY